MTMTTEQLRRAFRQSHTLNLSAGDDADGHWVTIEGEHVFIKGGRIDKGPAGIVGKKIGELPARSKPKTKLGHDEASYHRAKLQAKASPKSSGNSGHLFDSTPDSSGKTGSLFEAREAFKKTHPRGKAIYKQAIESAGLKHQEVEAITHVDATADQVHAAMEAKGLKHLKPGDYEHNAKAITTHKGDPVHQYFQPETGKLHLVASKAPAPFDADASGASKPQTGIFGQTAFDAATGNKQSAMFDTAKPVDAGKIAGSKSALDPKNTAKIPFNTQFKSVSDSKLAEAHSKGRPFTFGDVFKSPDGRLGIMRGGELGNDRVQLRTAEGDLIGHYSKSELTPHSRRHSATEVKERLDTPESREASRQLREDYAAKMKNPPTPTAAPQGGERQGKAASHNLVKDPIAAGKGFTRAELHRHILNHHAEMTGGDVAAQAEFDRSGTGSAQTTFHKELPQEVKTYLEGNRGATRLFRTTQTASQAGGADAMGDLGESKYFAHIDRMSGSNMEAALQTAHNSQDPEMRFAAKIHDNMPSTEAAALRGQAVQHANKAKASRKEAAGAKTPEEKAKHEARAAFHESNAAKARAEAKEAKNVETVNIDASRLKVGREFQSGGHPMRVVEDEDGHKVLHGFGETFPLEALKSVPVDRGSLRKLKMGGDDIAPFSADQPTLNLARESFRRYATAKAREAFRAYAASMVAAPIIQGDWIYSPTQNLSALVTDNNDLLCLGIIKGQDFKPTPAVLEGYPSEVGGLPAKYFEKELIKTSTLVHPTKEFTVKVDRPRIDHWVREFQKMKANGMKVFIPDDHSRAAADNNGYVMNMWREGDSLMGLCQFIGEDAAEKAAKNECSIGIGMKDIGHGQKGLKDGLGNRYIDPIQHVALTVVPVAPGLKPFKPVAA